MRARGFTLVEVMVALMVVAIALPALMVTLYRQAEDTGYLRDKSLAQMVAANKLAELRIVTFSRQRLDPGKSTGIARLADREWYWALESRPTQAENFFEVEVTVATSEDSLDSPVYSLVTFMSSDISQVPRAGSGGPGAGTSEGPLGSDNPSQGGGDPAPGSTPVGIGDDR